MDSPGIQATAEPQQVFGVAGMAITVIFSGFLAFAYGFGIYLFPVLSPDMKLELGFSYAQMGYIAAGIQAGFIASSVLSGLLAPRVGELRCICGAMLFCGLFLMALSYVQTPLQAAVVMLLIGFVPAATWVPMVAVVRRFIPYARRGMVFGFLSGSGGYGAIINGQVVPLLQDDLGWRGIWLWTGTAVLVFTVLSIVLFRLMKIVDDISTPAAAAAPGAPTMAIGAGIARFNRATLRVAMHLWLIMILGAAVTISYQTFFTALIRDYLEVARVLAGRMTFLHGCVGIVAAPLVGYLADRRDVRVCFLLVVFCTFAACMLMYLANSIAYVITSAVFFGFAFYPFFALPPAYASKALDSRTAVQVFAVGNIFVGAGALLGNMFGSGILKLFQTLPAVFAGLAVLTVILAIVIIALPHERTATHDQRS
ncbi:MFS transporter [uncultured Ruegeria sp.]|uniref:MFS transporter n=1 Tax=uncultured Ruegeria sp. TaxID=259304 RepID=UPI0026139839|nr:MFS transporter [uncultured Ruegeria sp.]